MGRRRARPRDRRGGEPPYDRWVDRLDRAYHLLDDAADLVRRVDAEVEMDERVGDEWLKVQQAMDAADDAMDVVGEARDALDDVR